MNTDEPLTAEEMVKTLRACIRYQQLPEYYDVTDDATTELAVQLAESQHETACIVACLRVAEGALEDIRGICDAARAKIEEIAHARIEV